MARARNIKPGFFINEDLVELPFETRLLFIGLWTVADRDGRLEDRPRKIKMAVFPSDDVDVSVSLDALESKGLIVRYIVENERFIEIVNFTKHQSPHRDEKASTIPAPYKHGASTVQIRLNPESLLLNPDSLNPENGKRKNAARAATTIDPEFEPLPKDKTRLAEECPTVKIDIETANFIDHYLGNGEKGKDWNAKWRKWIRNQHKWNLERKPKTQPPKADLLSPDYKSNFVLTFEIGMESEPPETTFEEYERLKEVWRQDHPERADAEIEEYERGSDFRQRFGKAESGRDSPSSETGRSGGHGRAETQMPVPRRQAPIGGTPTISTG